MTVISAGACPDTFSCLTTIISMYSNLQTPKRDFNDSLKRLELPQNNKKEVSLFFRELHSKAIKTCVRRSKKPLFVDNYQRKGGHTGFFLS